jgi:serine/threonine protein kinase
MHCGVGAGAEEGGSEEEKGQSDLEYGEIIGRGSCAVVYDGTWRCGARRRVAIKVMRNASRKLAHAIDAEVTVLQLFGGKDNHIIELLEVFHHPTQSELVLEHAPLGNLFDALHANKPKKLFPSVKWHIFENIAQGVSTMHKFGWVHGDIKLENILLFSVQGDGRGGGEGGGGGGGAGAGGGVKAKLCDFSHSFRPGKEQMVFGHGYGTVDYMAPEAVRAKRGDITAFVSFPADVWAMGILAWELFVSGPNGTPLFCRDTLEETKDAILNFPIPKRSFQVCHDTPDVTPLLFSECGMLQRDASKRMTSFQVLREAQKKLHACKEILR